jgi:hypothetical protein
MAGAGQNAHLSQFVNFLLLLWGICPLGNNGAKGGGEKNLVVVFGVVSDGEALLSTLLRNLDMVVSVECSPRNWLWLEFKNTREL